MYCFLCWALLESYWTTSLSFLRIDNKRKQYKLILQLNKKKRYQSKTPNKYLADFALFLFENETHPFIKELINEGIDIFIKNHILQYAKELESVPLHFVGSIAFHAKEYISNRLIKNNLNAASYIQRPIDNLIAHLKREH